MLTQIKYFLILFAILPALDLQANSRIKDLTTVIGDRDNQLVGYGLVVGLSGTGDSNQATYTIQSIANSLQRFGISVPAATLRSKNVAAVMITADIPSFSQTGQRIDVLVSAMGDSTSLQGGILLQAPLIGADDNVYAVAQGAIMVGGMIGGGGGTTVQRNHPTVGQISGGALVERTVPTNLIQNNESIQLSLINPDYVTAARMAETINQFFPLSTIAPSPSHVDIKIPDDYLNYPIDFIAAVGSINIQPDNIARVVLNERTGTIVATQSVRISEVAISHGSLTITVASTPYISQPPGFSEGDTIEASIEDVTIEELNSGMGHLQYAPTLETLTASLNALGLTTRDIMAIFQSLKRAGALQAELIIN